MANFLSSLFFALFIAVVLLLVTLLISAGLLVIGGLLANWFNVTRLEATAVSMAVGFAFFYLVMHILRLPPIMPDEWGDEED